MPILSTCARCAAPTVSKPAAPKKYCSRACAYASRVSNFDYRKWHEDNREDQNAKKTAWRIANPEKRKEIQRAWRQRNKKAIAESSNLRRAIYRAGVSKADVTAIMAAAEGYCTYCGQSSDRLELDHVEPVARGGEHSTDNFVPACRSCNASKGDRVAEDWIYDRFGIEGLARAVAMLESRERVVL